jgi:four helix bundle protein
MTNDENEPSDELVPWEATGASARVGEDGKPYDLEERTAQFGEMVIDFAKRVPSNEVTTRLIPQVVGAGTSIGANYCEADDAVSKKEFRYRIGICKKEARETKFFVRMIVRAVPDLRNEAKPVWQEAKELHLIFSKIWRSSELLS